jgi:FXSXX-COOH protein
MSDMEGPGPHIETALLDVNEVPPEELWWADDSALSQVLRELVEDARQGDDGATVAAFNASL